MRRRDVAGHGGVDGVQGLRAGDGDGIDGAVELGAEGAQREFAVVAGADGFAHRGGAGGLQAGEQDAGLDLGAGNGRGVVDGAGAAPPSMVMGAWPSVSVRRAPMASSGLRMRSMGRRESEASPIRVKRALLRREQAGDHAHGRAGVAAVERLAGRSDAAADAGDLDRCRRPVG